MRPKGKFIRERRARGVRLPGDRYGMLVGKFDRQTLSPLGSSKPDDNHVYLWLRVPDRPGYPAGRYECAVNIHSASGSLVEFAELEEELGGVDPPPFGFHASSLRYEDLGLTDDDFVPVRSGDLHTLVSQMAASCDRIAVHGTSYTDGIGMHDIHLCDDLPGRRRGLESEGTDGALIFYFREETLTARWICIKFGTQRLWRPGEDVP